VIAQFLAGLMLASVLSSTGTGSEVVRGTLVDCPTIRSQKLRDGSSIRPGELSPKVKQNLIRDVFFTRREVPTVVVLVEQGGAGLTQVLVRSSLLRSVDGKSIAESVRLGPKTTVRRLCGSFVVRTNKDVVDLPVFVLGGDVVFQTKRKTFRSLIGGRGPIRGRQCLTGNIKKLQNYRSIVVVSEDASQWCRMGPNGPEFAFPDFNRSVLVRDSEYRPLEDVIGTLPDAGEVVTPGPETESLLSQMVVPLIEDN
jgi:hypothetical protein